MSDAATPCLMVEEVRARPETLAEVERHVRRYVEATRALEAGCRSFDVAADTTDPRVLRIYGTFAGVADAERHLQAPHTEAFRAAVAPLAEAHDIQQFLADPKSASPGRVLVAVPILATDRGLLQGLERAGFELVFNDLGRAFSEHELIERLPGVVATIAGIEPYTERVFRAAPTLRCIARFGVGYDQIDLDAARRHGVTVVMAFGSNHEAVADHALALMAALAHQTIAYDRRVRAGEWGTLRHRGLHGAVVGIVGFGRIGRALARRCRGFAARILVHDPAVDAETIRHLGCEPVALETLLREADFVSLHCPLSPETRHLMDARRLSLMRPTAYLVNTARGALIDEAALVEALREGRIAGAGLDVFETEPPAGSPLLALDKVVLSPHVAGLSEDAIRRMAAMCVDNILHVLRGEDPGEGRVLDPETLRLHA